ncbi:MAG: hypothetical protein V1906_00190 [Candidatus Woesearchaeota archaeon]
MRIESHEKRLAESIGVIDESLDIGLEKRQRNIGFNASAAAIDMLEILLHKAKKVSSGFVIKHDWFNSRRKIEEKIGFDFPRKGEIIRLISLIESKRNRLCYGTPQDVKEIRAVIDAFNKLKSEFRMAEHEIG